MTEAKWVTVPLKVRCFPALLLSTKLKTEVSADRLLKIILIVNCYVIFGI